jgi:LysR family glycine cleavage system transcriptional activator
MVHTLPPLVSARAFEAAARHLSFQMAAEELHVTPSAISHQIKFLETYLGVELFHRTHRGVSLTKEGAGYLGELRKAFGTIAAATKDLRQGGLSGPLAIGATSAFISRWIMPRLHSFTSAYPDIDLGLNALVAPLDFGRSELDAAVCVGPKDWAGLRADRIMSSPIFPVCSPKLGRTLKDPGGLQQHILLHYDNGEEWSRWLRAAHVTNIDVSSGLRFNDCNLMLQASVDSLGIGLTFTALAERELQAGLLVRPFERTLLPKAWYYFVSPETTAHRPKITAFRNWILHEARETARQDPVQGIAYAM